MNDMNLLIPNEVGIWIECCNSNCKKWRYTLDYDDPLAVPKKWYCHMNSDRFTNNCSVPEYLQLDEGEVFVESKFKAGSIVWAKVMGHPWSPAMVDFCPEFDAYYWFDEVDTNVPSQYHVTFLSGKAITRAWIKRVWIKSFVGTDPSVVLKSTVRKKNLTARQKGVILKGCHIAQAALRLTISERLKKYNFNSWKLVQQLQNQSTNSPARPIVPAAARSSKESPRAVAGPSGTSKLRTVKNIQTKKKAVKKESCDKLTPNLRKDVTTTVNRCLRSANKESEKGKMVLRPASSQKLSTEEDSQYTTTVSVNTETTISDERKDEEQGLHDTRSINSYDWTDFAEASSSERISMAGEKRVVKPGLDAGPAMDIFTDRRLSEEESIEITDTTPDEIIPDSQPSTAKKDPFKNIVRNRNDEADKMSNGKQLAKEKEKFEGVAKSSKNSGLRRHSIDFEPKSIMREGKRLNITEHKSASDNSLRTENKENESGDSRYLRALSEFTPREPNPFFNSTDYLQLRKIPRPKPLPDWFFNQEKRRIAEAKRLSRLSKLSDEEDKRMYKESRESFIAEMESAAEAGPSIEEKKLVLKPPSYFMRPQNYEHLLTSDEDSV